MPTRRAWPWMIVLGFALGGFLDGILLHQILQWHHLLSRVPEVGELRRQVLWDGVFHALMYALAAAALAGLWRARDGLATAGAATIAGAGLVGFGLWHAVDGIVSHWLLGLHRIRMDSAAPLVWDLVFFIGLGLVPALIGGVLMRRGPTGPGSGSRARPAAVVLALGLVTGGAGLWALQPPPDRADVATVVFRGDLGPDGAFRAMAATGAGLVWASPDLSVAVLQVAPEQRWALYRHGAVMVGGAGTPAGCAGWSRPAAG